MPEIKNTSDLPVEVVLVPQPAAAGLADPWGGVDRRLPFMDAGLVQNQVDRVCATVRWEPGQVREVPAAVIPAVLAQSAALEPQVAKPEPVPELAAAPPSAPAETEPPDEPEPSGRRRRRGGNPS